VVWLCCDGQLSPPQLLTSGCPGGGGAGASRAMTVPHLGYSFDCVAWDILVQIFTVKTVCCAEALL
jgi:hypothetical protein